MLTQIDIDDLLQRCRTANARTYLREAVDCYRIGAYRACVICTWIAVVYDVIDKLREIALTGDKKAVAQVKLFDEIQKKRDTDGALKFEREVLTMAKDDFELIAAQEFADLVRLWEDRNRCGHPNLTHDTTTYTPSPELARLHLRIAVEHVLGRPPVQGEAALKLLRETVDSEFFPTDVEKAKSILGESAIVRAKAQLVEAFVTGALLSIIREELTTKMRRQRIAAALAVQRIHPISTQALLEARFADFLSKTKDDCLHRVIWLLAQVPDYQAFVRGANETRLNSYVSALPADKLEFLQYALNLKVVQNSAGVRLDSCTEPEFYGMAKRLECHPTEAFVERCVGFYETAKNFSHANTLATTVVSPVLSYMTKPQVERIVRSAANDEVRGSFAFKSVLSEIIQKKSLSRAEVLALLDSVGHMDVAAEIPESGSNE